jgi:peptide/nickel transport system ATP-binding protein/oligopeptide transport system ATP-binding protein
MTLLEASGLVKRYPLRRTLLGRVKDSFTAVDDVGFHIEPGETLALVGESGAGKSTTGRLVLRLIEPDAGEIRFEGNDLRALGATELRRTRLRMQMVFQDPYSSLDPHLPVGDSVGEPLVIHFGTPRRERERKSAELLDKVGISRQAMQRYPTELSGGQLQRVAIARALMTGPALIVADEPIAALDVSVRAQVLNLMRDLQEELGVAYLFVTHDLALVQVIADRVAVMRSGRIVEEGPVANVFARPQEDYTRELLSAIPNPVPRRMRV